jgi:hypothetical protein
MLTGLGVRAFEVVPDAIDLNDSAVKFIDVRHLGIWAIVPG